MPGGQLYLASAGQQSRRRKKKTGKITKPVAKTVSKMISNSKPSKQKRFAYSFAHNTSVPASAMYSVSLTNIANGDATNEKIGSSIKISSIHIKIALGNAGATARGVRIMLLRAKNPADQPDITNYTDLYEDENFNNAAPTAISSDGLRHVNRDVYKVYYDKVITLGSQSTIRQPSINKWIKLNRKVTYSTLSSNTASNGRIFLIYNLYNNDNVNDVSSCRISHFTTVYFKDA